MEDSVIYIIFIVYCNRFFNYFIHPLSYQSHDPDEEWYNHSKYWFVKRITESFTSFVLFFLYVLFILQTTPVLKENIKSLSIRGKLSRQLPTLM